MQTPVRGTVHDWNVMTLTIKDSTEMNGPGKPGAPSQNSENKAGQSTRSNPVCLEVGVTIRSLPAEAGGQTQPILEEGRTVIVFDNGAVLRSTKNLPIGLTVILSNPSGLEVGCRVVGGRNLPSVKGYVEVEFIEPANDFWRIHQDADPAPFAAPQATPPAPLESPAPPPPAPPRVAAPLEPPAKPESVSLGSPPMFEDIPGLVSVNPSAATRESKTKRARPGAELRTKDNSNYNPSDAAKPTSLANWNSPASKLPAKKPAIPAARESSSITPAATAPSRDILSKGLMAYDQPQSSSTASNRRIPLLVGGAALALAGVCAVVFFMRQKTAPVPVAETTVVSQPSTPEPPAANSASERAQAPREETAQSETQSETETAVVEQAQRVAAVAPVPAVVTSPAITDSGTESRNFQRGEKNAVANKQPALSSSSRPTIRNLKMGSPRAPKQDHSSPGEGIAPMTDIASTEAVGGAPPAGMLTSAGRISNQPASPLFAPAPVAAAKTASDPKLISSTRLVYPAAAKASNIHGNVMVSASIDTNGKVVSAKALSGPFLLRQAAEESVKQWKYSPGLIDGKPASSQVTVNVEFRLN